MQLYALIMQLMISRKNNVQIELIYKTKTNATTLISSGVYLLLKNNLH